MRTVPDNYKLNPGAVESILERPGAKLSPDHPDHLLAFLINLLLIILSSLTQLCPRRAQPADHRLHPGPGAAVGPRGLLLRHHLHLAAAARGRGLAGGEQDRLRPQRRQLRDLGHGDWGAGRAAHHAVRPLPLQGDTGHLQQGTAGGRMAGGATTVFTCTLCIAQLSTCTNALATA